jgi:hypothetical protein
MLNEVTSTPTPEVAPTTPAPELETETTANVPEYADDQATEGTDNDQPTATVEDGTAEGVTADEDRRAGLREADYTRKTQEVAEIRKALEARSQRLDSVVQQGEAIVHALTEEFQAEFQGIDWGKLAAEDPAEYVRKQHALTTRQGKLNAALYRLNEARQAQAQNAQQSLQERLRQEQAALVEKMPEWKDAKKYAAESAELSDYLSQSGYAPEEVSGVTDHRAVILARKAMLYDRMVAKTPASKPVTQAPAPVPKAPTKATGQKDPLQMTDKEFAEWRKRQIAQRR